MKNLRALHWDSNNMVKKVNRQIRISNCALDAMLDLKIYSPLPREVTVGKE